MPFGIFMLAQWVRFVNNFWPFLPLFSTFLMNLNKK